MFSRSAQALHSGAGRTLVLLTVLACSLGCTKADGQVDDGLVPEAEQIVAVANGHEISVHRFNASYVDFLIRTGMNDTRRNRYAHLDNLIDAYLMADEAHALGLDEDEGFQAYRDIKAKETVGGRFFQTDFVDSLADVTDLDVREAFRRNRQKIVVRHLLYPTYEEAEAAYRRLREGESFIGLANEAFKTAEFDSMAGYLGVAGYWELDDAFAEAAWELLPGEFSKPVRTRYGWHVILVEEKVVQPLLTESEYQYRREGMQSKARIRKYRIEGDQYVRSYMESLDVDVNAQAVYALSEAIRAASGDPDPTRNPQAPLLSEEVDDVRGELVPETVLATYMLDGERHAFTVGQYLDWLALLPFGEARSRTAASIGRALRNEVFAQRGFAAGLDEDPIVEEEMAYRTSAYLAALMRQYVREERQVEPTEEQARDAFERFGFRKLEAARADFWAIPFETFAEADSARSAIAEADTAPSSFERYERHTNADLLKFDELGFHLRKAPEGQVLILGTADRFYVAHVGDRHLQWTDFEAKRDEIVETLKWQLPVIELIKELRAKGDVEVDVELFEEIMKLEDRG